MSWVTLIIAVIGATLGVFNTIRDVLRDRVRLKVIPQTADLNLGDGKGTRPCLAIEVVNLSTFPVTVSEVGYTLRGAQGRRVVQPQLLDGGSWPRRLEPHESVTVFAHSDQDHSWLPQIDRAFAKTPSGHVETGTSDGLKWIVRNGRLPNPAIRIRGQPGAILRTDAPDT